MCSQKCLNLSKSKSFLNIYILMPTKENKTCSVFCDITRAYLLLSILRFAKSFWADPLFQWRHPEFYIGGAKHTLGTNFGG